MEFEGLVFRILPVVRGTSARGEWQKQEVIFELPGEFSRKVCVGFWGDKVADLARLKEGDKVSVSANVESREYNGRWFTEVRAWKFSTVAAQQPAGASAPAGMPESAPLSSLEEFSSDSGDTDDLPF